MLSAHSLRPPQWPMPDTWSDDDLVNEIDQSNADTYEQPILNFDILRLVCDCLTDVPDVLSFALTCSAMTEDAFRRRLRMAPVYLRNGELVREFHAFIFSNAPSRAPHIYGLRIRTDSYYDHRMKEVNSLTVGRCLVAILEAAIHLQYVYFPTSLGIPVFDALFKTVTTLRELRIFIDGFHPTMRGILPNLLSPLRFLHIVGNNIIQDHVSASSLHDHLSHLAPALEFLELDSFNLDITPSSVTTPFLAMRSLKIRTTFYVSDFHPLDVLVRLFPKLDNTLDVRTVGGNLDAEDDYPWFRQLGVDVQKHRAWSALDRLVCSATVAFLLALQCPIRRMDIKAFPAYESQYLADTLRHDPPPSRRLHLHLELYWGFRAVDRLFPLEGVEMLTHLIIFADVRVKRRRGARCKAGNIHWDRLIRKLIVSLVPLRLTHLRIVFHAAVHQAARQPPPPPLPYADDLSTSDSDSHDCDPRDSATVTVQGAIDPFPDVVRIFDVMPSLEYVLVTTCGCTHLVPSKRTRWSWRWTNVCQYPAPVLIHDRWLSSRAWRAVRGSATDVCPGTGTGTEPEAVRSESDPDAGFKAGTGRVAVEISGEEAERIIQQEELRLSGDMEDKLRECDDLELYGNASCV